MNPTKMRMGVLRRVVLFTGALLGVSMAVALGWHLAVGTELRVTSYRVSSPRLPASFDDFRIMLVTDLHGATFGSGQRDLVRAIRGAGPDVIVLAGDYTSRPYPRDIEDLAAARELVAALPHDVPIVYLLGNWDGADVYGDVPDVETVSTRALESEGASPAVPAVAITRGRDRIWLHSWRVREFADRSAVETFVTEASRAPGVSPERIRASAEKAWRFQSEHVAKRDFSIAVTHRPIDFDDYGAWLTQSAARTAEARRLGDTTWTRLVDYDLNLAGHTHAGQWRLPWAGGIVSPEARLFPGDEHLVGLSQDQDGRWRVISAGLGAGGPFSLLRFRYANPPEVVLVTLRRSEGF